MFFQLNVHVYVRTLSGEAFVSQLLSVHSAMYFLPETGIAWLVWIVNTEKASLHRLCCGDLMNRKPGFQ